MRGSIVVFDAQARLTVGHAKAMLAIKDHAAQLLTADQIIRRLAERRLIATVWTAVAERSADTALDSS